MVSKIYRMITWLSVIQKEYVTSHGSKSVLRRELHGETHSKRGPRRTRLKEIESLEIRLNEAGIPWLQSDTSLWNLAFHNEGCTLTQ